MAEASEVAVVDVPVTPVIEEFPVLPEDRLCVSFQIPTHEARAGLMVRSHASKLRKVSQIEAVEPGELWARYTKPTQLDVRNLKWLAFVLTAGFYMRKETPKGIRVVATFWFARGHDSVDAVAQEEFDRLSSHVYAVGESYVNPDGSACILLKGVATCAPRTILRVVRENDPVE